MASKERSATFKQRAIGYLEQAGWRVVQRADWHVGQYGSGYVAYPDYLRGPVAGSNLEAAFYSQMQRDFEAGVPGRFLSFPDKSGEPLREGEE